MATLLKHCTDLHRSAHPDCADRLVETQRAGAERHGGQQCRILRAVLLGASTTATSPTACCSTISRTRDTAFEGLGPRGVGHGKSARMGADSILDEEMAMASLDLLRLGNGLERDPGLSL